MSMFFQGGCYFGCDKPCTCNYTRTQPFCYSAVAYILTPSVNLAFGSKSGFKFNVGLEPGSGL